MAKKQGFILFEVILSIALFFIIFSVSSKLIFKLQEKNISSSYESLALLKLESTKQFLSNNQNLNLLYFNKNELYYDGALVLNKVSSYSKSTIQEVTIIDICIDKNRVCTTWKLKN